MTRAFTLVELLVVITILALLIALLMPALDRAVYEAQLAVCGSRLRGTSTGVLTYAMEHGRRYPHRAGVHDLNLTATWVPVALSQGANNVTHDDRPLLRDYLSINGMLNDPTLPRLDFDHAAPESWVWVSYNLWFGFRFGSRPSDPRKPDFTDKGMFRMGDRLGFSDNGAQPERLYRVLASDFFFTRVSNIDIGCSHPDRADLLQPVAEQDADTSEAARARNLDPDGKLTYSRWQAYGVSVISGPVDLNFAWDDGAVLRMRDVGYHDYAKEDRVDRVGLTQKSGSYPDEWNLIAR